MREPIPDRLRASIVEAFEVAAAVPTNPSATRRSPGAMFRDSARILRATGPGALLAERSWARMARTSAEWGIRA